MSNTNHVDRTVPAVIGAGTGVVVYALAIFAAYALGATGLVLAGAIAVGHNAGFLAGALTYERLVRGSGNSAATGRMSA